MSRIHLVLFLVLAASCADDEPNVRAINPHTGEIGTFSSGNVPPGWLVCPVGSDCPEPIACSALGESDCLARSDCEAIYQPSTSSADPVKFVECRAKPPVCADEGESCTNTKCCDGLSCCAGVPVPTGAEYCTAGACPISDRNKKHAIVPVDPDSILDRLNKLPVATWTYNFESDGVRHMGPMAQDFAAAFGLGSTDRRIFTIDADGVALASIQALSRRVEKLQTTNTELDAENTALRDRLHAIEQRTARLERAKR